ncbi:uncharacterized protein [Antedon mediterranea]|uniref:uncharacterized protein n=1 Tax=Antedon mediterranea TaxID=105859 RepID=UPI003AF979E4
MWKFLKKFRRKKGKEKTVRRKKGDDQSKGVQNSATSALATQRKFKRGKRKEQHTLSDSTMNSIERGLERDRRELKRDEQKIENDIKKAEKRGDKQTCKSLQKHQQVLRTANANSHKTSANVSAVRTQAKTMQSTKTVVTAMENTTKAIKAMNKQMPCKQIANQMHAFERESNAMTEAQELMDLLESGDVE